jgi:hypothetical protein
MEKIVIKTCDENWFVLKNEEDMIGFSPNILDEDIAKFDDVGDAKNFAKEYLNENDTYNIVKVEMGYTEQLLDTINY